MITDAAAQTPENARRLHRALLVGLLVISAVFLVVGIEMHAAPLLVAGAGTAMIGYALAACCVALIISALFVLKPRVIPPRAPGQDAAAYWRGALGGALGVWFLIAAAGISSAVGALITGTLAPTIVVVIALGCLVTFGPNHFENA